MVGDGQHERAGPTTGRPRRPVGTATYRRRRATAVAVVLLLAGALALVLLDGGGEGGSSPAAGGPEAPPERSEPVRLSVSVSGDLLIHSPVFFVAAANAGGSGYDFVPMLTPLRRWVKDAGLAICHAETPIGAGAPAGEPLFNAPAELAEAIAKTGWDACTTASNHSLDLGQEGVDATLKRLDRAGVEHTGSYPSRPASRRPLILRPRGVRVALLAYTTDTNGIPSPSEWTVNRFDPDRVLDDARRARERGAEAVIVSVHWASEIKPEYVSDPTAAQRRAARRLAKAPEITAVVGQGPHVVQPIEWAGETPIVYSAGNLLSNQSASCCAAASQDGIIALLDLVVDAEGARVSRVRYVPIWVRRPDYAVLPVGRALARGEADPAALRASWERTVDVIGRDGRTGPVPAKLGG